MKGTHQFVFSLFAAMLIVGYPMEPTFFDTNILVYATLDQDVVKKRIAVSLIMEAVASDSFCISAQVLKEFANVLIRKSNRLPQEIREDVRRFSPFIAVPDTPDLVLNALDLRRDSTRRHLRERRDAKRNRDR